MTRTRAVRSAWIAGTAALALILTACGGGSDSSSSASLTVGGAATATAGGEASGTIEYWLWDANQLPAYQDCATAFSKKYPNAKVNITQYGWDDYWAKINNGFTSGTGPDVFTDHLSKYPEFVNKQFILNLSDALKADGADKDIYQPGLLSLWTAQDGGVYGLPKDFDTVGLFYNEDMITAAGYTDADLQNLTWNPTDGGTFEKFIAHMTIDKNGVRGDEPGFDKSNVKTYGFGQENLTDGNGQTQWSPFTGSNGWTYTDKNPWGTKFNYGDDKFNETMTFYKSLSEKGYSPTIDKTVGVDTGAQLGAGAYATVIEGDWNTSSYMKKGVNLKIAPTPIGPSGSRASMFNGLADSVNAATKNQATAVKWVEFTGSQECQDLVAAKAVVFPAIPASTDKAEAAFKAAGTDMSGFTVQVKDKTTFLFPITDHAADVTALMAPALQAFMGGQADVTSFKDVNDQVNALFQ
jgi:multiple sugar transport system substrate-binding protein